LATVSHLRDIHEDITALRHFDENAFDKLEQKLQTMHQTVSKVEDDESRAAIYNWVSQVDPSINYFSAQKLLQLKASNGSWLLQNPEFEQWVSGMKKFFWLKGSCKVET
jgi:hypothetical protein